MNRHVVWVRNINNVAESKIKYKKIKFNKFTLPCGMAYENKNFTLSQDWELPIQVFFVVSPKRHVEKFCELTNQERNETMSIVNKTVKILR